MRDQGKFCRDEEYFTNKSKLTEMRESAKNRSTKSETREVGPQWACQLWKEWRTSWAWDHLLPSNVRAIVIHNVAKCKEHKAELQRQGLGNWATCCQWSLK